MDAIWSQASTIERIRVLFVDHDCTQDAFIRDMFAYFSCEVTMVRLASIALSMLSHGNMAFDLVMQNIDPPDSFAVKLLRDATTMGLPVILLTEANDPLTIVRGMEEGALFCIQKPITLDFVKYAWQHVLREKLQKMRENERLQGLMAKYAPLNIGMSTWKNNNVSHVNGKETSITMNNERTARVNSSNDQENINVQRKSVRRHGKANWLEWTPELHDKFVDVVNTLGEGNCYPNDILKQMNVPGLTRMQVASHLQKCRYGTCKYFSGGNQDPNYNVVLKNETSSARSRGFGSMPCINQYLVKYPSFNSISEVNIDDNLVEEPNTFQCPLKNGIQDQNSQVNNHQKPVGHIPIENVGLEGMSHGDLSIYDMLTPEDLSILDGQGAMNMENSSNEVFHWQELFKDFDMDDESIP